MVLQRVALLMSDNRDAAIRAPSAASLTYPALAFALNALYSCAHGYDLLYYRMDGPVCAHASQGMRNASSTLISLQCPSRDERQPIGLARPTASRVSPVRATPVAMIPRHGLLGGSRPVAAEPLQSLARTLPTVTTCTCAMRLHARR